MCLFSMMDLHMLVIILIASYQISSVHTVPFEQTTVKSEESALDFIILHNNDLHGRFEESSIVRMDCKPEELQQHKCFGGFARHSTVIKKHRKDYQDGKGLPVLYMNAGDTYTGTAWFFLFKDKIAAELMNALKPDVGSLGNHEFDYGVSGLVPYLNNITFPIVAANINVTEDHPLWKTKALQRSVVFHINGFKVGVVGYVLKETENRSKTKDVPFLEEIDAINAEAAELHKNGVNIIIALGHSGYTKDQEIAKNCPLVDVVVGAHSHSFLYTGTPPEPDPVKGPYPTVVQQESGKKVPVVQAYAYSKYLGKLELSFDKDGNLLRWSGLPILMDYTIEKDPEINRLLDKYRPEVDALDNDIPGNTKVNLSSEYCAVGECNLGNLIVDASVYARAKEYNGPGWTDASIALINSGGIRQTIEIGNVSKYMLSTVLPFQNQLILVNIPGHVLKDALEHSVEFYGTGADIKPFLQVSGLHVVYDLHKDAGNRVQSVEVLCSICNVPIYEKLNMVQTYGIVIDAFLHGGGDGYSMFKQYTPQGLNTTAFDTTYDYMKHLQLIYTPIDGRTKFVGQLGKSLAVSIIPLPLMITLFSSLLIAFKLLSFD